MGTYLPGSGNLGWGSWCGTGTPCSQDIPPEFLSTNMDVGPARSASAPLLPIWMDVVSLIP